MSRDIKKEMMELLGGEFLEWYSNLNDEEKQQYNIEFNKLQDNDIPHSDIRRMESEGVYEEKFQRNSSKSPTYFNDEWNDEKPKDIQDWEETPFGKAHKKFTTNVGDYDDKEHSLNLVDNFYDESHALDMVMNDMVKDMDIQDFEDDDAYEDGVDERPIKNDKEYNDDNYDY